MRRVLFPGLVVLSLGGAVPVHARPRSGPVTRSPAQESSPPTVRREGRALPIGILGRFGAGAMEALIASENPDDNVRGFERACVLGTADALGRVAASLENVRYVSDPRILLVVAQELSTRASESMVRKILLSVVGASVPSVQLRATSVEAKSVSVRRAQAEFAREMAAMALARSNVPVAIDALLDLVGGEGPGSEASGRALYVAIGANGNDITEGGLPLAPTASATLGRMGDLRALGKMRALLSDARALEPKTLPLLALAALGDGKSLDLFRSASKDPNDALRVAGVTALALVGSPLAPQEIADLLANDATVHASLELAERVSHETVTRALAARAVQSSDPTIRHRVLRALGTQSSDEAIAALRELGTSEDLAGDVAHALARSPNPRAESVLASWMAEGGSRRRLALRALLVRAAFRPIDRPLGKIAASLAQNRGSSDRALAAFVRGTQGGDVRDLFEDADVNVRRAAWFGVAGHRPSWARERMLLGMAHEKSESVRELLLGVLEPKELAALPRAILEERASSGGVDAPRAVLGLAAQLGPEDVRVAAWLRDSDPGLRAHALLGLAFYAHENAVGRIAEVLRFESDALVRRAAVWALAQREGGGPIRLHSLDVTARLDPDPLARAIAHQTLAGRSAPAVAGGDYAWFELVESYAGAARGISGYLLDSIGLSHPVAFDADGFALVPGLTVDGGRMVLAPKLSQREAVPR